MPAIQDPNLGLNYGWALGEDNWNAGMDANIKKLGTVVQLAVLAMNIAAPPSSPAAGARYIIPAGATGDWAGKENQIAVRIGDAWEYYAPAAGWHAYNVDDGATYVFSGAAWGDLAAQGEQGPAGPAGAAGAAGQGYTQRGAWNGATAYVPYDVVSHNGSSWAAIANSTNIVPAEGAAWTLLAAKGDQGPAGAQGEQGPAGSGGSGGGAEADFIAGLELSIVGNTWDETVQVSPGAAWVPGLNKVVRLAAATNCTPGSLTAQQYYVYLGESGGSPTLECSATEPAYYQGDAMVKTGDNTKRFIGYYYRDGTIGINGFHAHANGNRVAHIWRKAFYQTPLMLLNGAGGTGSDNTLTPQVSGNNANLIPPCAAELHLMVRLACAANSRMFVGLSQFNVDAGTGDSFGGEVLLENDNPTGSTREITANVTIHLNRGVQSLHWWTQAVSGSGASLSIYLRGITYRR